MRNSSNSSDSVHVKQFDVQNVSTDKDPMYRTSPALQITCGQHKKKIKFASKISKFTMCRNHRNGRWNNLFHPVQQTIL